MLVLVLILVVIALVLLLAGWILQVVALAWTSVGISVLAGLALLYDWWQTRSAERAGDGPAASGAGAADDRQRSETAARHGADMEPATQVLPVVRPDTAGRPGAPGTGVPGGPAVAGDTGNATDATVQMPVVGPSGSPEAPPGVSRSSGSSSLSVTNEGDEALPDARTGTPDAGDAEPGREGTGRGGDPDPTGPDGDGSPTAGPAGVGRPEASGSGAPAAAGTVAAGTTGTTDAATGSGRADDGEPGFGTGSAATGTSVPAAGGAPAGTGADERAGGSGAADQGTRQAPDGGVDGGAATAVPAGATAADGTAAGEPVSGGGTAATAAVAGQEPADTGVGATSTDGADTRSADAPRGAAGGGGADAPGDQGASEDGEAPEEPRDPTLTGLVARLPDEVLVIDEHPRYHVQSCRSLGGRPVIPLPVSEAVELGFTPCAWCAPNRTLGERHPAQVR